jgi:hypothetical protein
MNPYRNAREQQVARKAKEKQAEVVGLLGVGLDNEDGHKRITRGDEFLLVGGSEETHERMQDVAIRVSESLKDRGKRLQDAAPEEVIDLIRKASDR